jgi:predicted DNA-binding protein
LKKRQSVRLPDDLKEALSKHMERTGAGFTTVVCDALWLFLETASLASRDLEQEAEGFVEQCMAAIEDVPKAVNTDEGNPGPLPKRPAEKAVKSGVDKARSALADFEID